MHSIPFYGILSFHVSTDNGNCSPTVSTPTDAPLGHESLTIDQLLSHLRPFTSKWFNLGKALLLNDDLLKKIYSSNDRDEESLREMLEVWFARSDLNHTREVVQAALKEVESSKLCIFMFALT